MKYNPEAKYQEVYGENYSIAKKFSIASKKRKMSKFKSVSDLINAVKKHLEIIDNKKLVPGTENNPVYYYTTKRNKIIRNSIGYQLAEYDINNYFDDVLEALADFENKEIVEHLTCIEFYLKIDIKLSGLTIEDFLNIKEHTSELKRDEFPFYEHYFLVLIDIIIDNVL